jgi:hypothetical protein
VLERDISLRTSIRFLYFEISACCPKNAINIP